MSKKMTKVMAMALAAAMTLSACGSTAPAEKPAETPAAPSTSAPAAPATPAAPEAPKAEPITDLVIGRLATRELETFNILYSTSFSDFENLTNMIDSLVEVDTKGNVVPAIAESWETNDNGLTWTFHLRRC